MKSVTPVSHVMTPVGLQPV